MNLKKILLPVLTMTGILVFASPTFAYETKPGDTMSEIASKYGMTLDELADKNPIIQDINLIYVGQEIQTGTTTMTTVPDVKAPAKVAPPVAKGNHGASASEIDLLARLVRAEAENEPYAGKVAVAAVVLNRVGSSQFPNTIQGVIYQAGQFNPVANGSINRPATSQDIKAVKEALAGAGSGALFFYNPKTATNRWLDSRPTVAVIGNHTFKK